MNDQSTPAYEQHIPIAEQMAPGNLFARAVAYLIDVIPITILVFISAYMFTEYGNVMDHYLKDPDAARASGEVTAWKYKIRFLAGLGYILYASLLESSPLKSTIGKRMLGMTVVDDNGERIQFFKAFSRNTMKILSALPALIGFFAALTNKRRRCWHDRLSATYVVKGKAPETHSANF